MSIFVDETTKVVYQGLTGGQGRFYGLLNRDYGTQVVAGTSPKKAGTDVDGIPVFANVGDAVAATGATASCIFIPAPGVKDAVIEAAEAGIDVHRVHHRGRARRTTRRGSSTSCGATSPTRGCSVRTARASSAPARQHRHHRRAHRQGGRPGRHREPLGHAHLPGALRAAAEGHRCHHLRRHRRRPGAGHQLHRLPARVRGRPRDQGRDDDRRDRWLGRGRGRRLHQVVDDQAGRRRTSRA